MRKKMLIVLCLLFILASGCKSTEQNIPDALPSPSAPAPVETERQKNPFANANLLDVDFAELENAVCRTAGTEQVALRFMYDMHPVDMFFLPNGGVTQLRTCLWAFHSVLGGDYIMNEYQTSGTTQFDISCTKEDHHFARELFNFDFKGLQKFTDWMYTADFQALLSEYVPGTPVGYRLVAGNIPAEFVDCPDASYLALDLSSEQPRKINLDFLHRLPDSYYLEFDLGVEYYALLPYYPVNGVSGCTVPLSPFGDGIATYAAPDGGEYSVNNILLLFPEGPAARP